MERITLDALCTALKCEYAELWFVDTHPTIIDDGSADRPTAQLTWSLAGVRRIMPDDAALDLGAGWVAVVLAESIAH